MFRLTSRPWYLSDVALTAHVFFGIVALPAPGAPQAKHYRARNASTRLLVKFRRRRPTTARAIGRKPFAALSSDSLARLDQHDIARPHRQLQRGPDAPGGRRQRPTKRAESVGNTMAMTCLHPDSSMCRSPGLPTVPGPTGTASLDATSSSSVVAVSCRVSQC